jgi:VWFA-related protein
MRHAHRRIAALLTLAAMMGLLAVAGLQAQTRNSELDETDERPSGAKKNRGPARPITIPITIRSRGSRARQELQEVGNIIVREDGEEQEILSIRRFGAGDPLAVAVLIQDDVVPSISNEIKAIGDFIRRLPRGSRVMVGYIRSGALDVRQKFTGDLDRAAGALRVPIGSATAAPYNPYVEVMEGLKRFEGLPKGRRAMLVISDGVDASRGLDSASVAQSIDLQRAVKQAQRLGVAIYSFYAPTVTVTARNNQFLASNGQGSLEVLADDTGGQAFFQGTGAPVSFDPFLNDLAMSFTRQIALTYLSTHGKKGYHRIEIRSDNTGVEIDHPSGYTR